MPSATLKSIPEALTVYSPAVNLLANTTVASVLSVFHATDVEFTVMPAFDTAKIALVVSTTGALNVTFNDLTVIALL